MGWVGGGRLGARAAACSPGASGTGCCTCRHQSAVPQLLFHPFNLYLAINASQELKLAIGTPAHQVACKELPGAGEGW